MLQIKEKIQLLISISLESQCTCPYPGPSVLTLSPPGGSRETSVDVRFCLVLTSRLCTPSPPTESQFKHQMYKSFNWILVTVNMDNKKQNYFISTLRFKRGFICDLLLESGGKIRSWTVYVMATGRLIHGPWDKGRNDFKFDGWNYSLDLVKTRKSYNLKLKKKQNKRTHNLLAPYKYVVVFFNCFWPS